MIVAGEFIDHPIFKEFKQVLVSTEEESAANSLEVNGHILTPKGFSKTKKLLQDLGKPIIEIPLTEYQKLDGGLSCLSLRY